MPVFAAACAAAALLAVGCVDSRARGSAEAPAPGGKEALVLSGSRPLPDLESLGPEAAARAVQLGSLPCPIGVRRPMQCVVAWSPDGGALAGSSLSTEVRIFDGGTGARIRAIGTGGETAVGVAISPDGTTIALTAGTQVLLHDLAGGGLLARFEGHAAQVRDAAFSPDGAFLAAGGDDGLVLVWDVRTGRVAGRMQGGRSYVLALDYSPDGRLLAEGSVDGRVRIRAADTGGLLRTLEIGRPVGDLAFSPDGELLATASDDNLIRLWTPGTGGLVRTLEGHTGYVNGIAFSPDGGLLASGGHDGQVGLWSVRDGRLLKFLPGHGDAVLRTAFRPDGRVLATISWDGTIRLWGVPR